MTHGRYKVVGQFNYRGHDPGDVFVARLDPGAERRAIQRGCIALLERVTPTLEPGSYTLPKGWAKVARTMTPKAGKE